MCKKAWQTPDRDSVHEENGGVSRPGAESATYGDGTCGCSSGHMGYSPSKRANEARRLLSYRTEAPC